MKLHRILRYFTGSVNLRFLVALTLLNGATDVSAEQGQHATPSITKSCTVPSDSRWTPQEKFVWEHVCAGREANFNIAQGYGGNLSPKKPDDWPKNRILRPAFIERILREDLYRRALAGPGLTIIGARFVDHLNLDSIELSSHLVIIESLFEKGVSLLHAHTQYAIGFVGSKIMGNFSMNSARVGAHLALQESEFDTIDLRTAQVGGQLIFVRSTVSQEANMNSLRTGDSILMSSARFFKSANLGTVFASNVDLSNATVVGRLGIEASQIRKSLFLDNAQLNDVDLGAIRIEQHLLLRKATVRGLTLDGAQVDGQLRLSGSKIAGHVSCYRLVVGAVALMDDQAVFSGSVDCQAAKIGADLLLGGSTFEKALNLSGATVGGRLVLDENTKWSKDASLNLRDVSIGSLPDLKASSWPPKLDIDGLTYRSVGAVEEFREWFGKSERYTPRQYEQLALVTQGQGDRNLATAIRYLGRERERSEATGREWVWLTTLKWVIGYGYYPYLSVIWVIAFVVIGALILRLSGEGPLNAMPYGVAYSLDMLLPIIRLRDSHYEIDLKTWARYYFYFHKIMGYVLASFLIAGLSGLAK